MSTPVRFIFRSIMGCAAACNAKEVCSAFSYEADANKCSLGATELNSVQSNSGTLKAVYMVPGELCRK